jgi:anaerobic selenocysteine-containing dehydrogenase
MGNITRRDFLKFGTLGVASGILAGCANPRRWVILEPFMQAPEEQLAGEATWFASTCRQCPAGCGIIVRIMNGRALKIEGNPEHPLNQGKLCARGQAGLQLLYNPDRLSGPVQQSQRGSRQYQSLTWEGALNTLYTKLADAGSAVAIWAGSTTSGHLLEIFQKFASGIGASAPVVFDLYTALNGYQAMSKNSQELFGKSGLPFYNISHADVVFSFGADVLSTGLSAVRYGRDYGAFRSQALGKRGFLVSLEPRMTLTGAKADQWLAIRPGTEGMVAQAILRLIADNSLGSAEQVQLAKSLASQVNLNDVAAASGLALADITTLARIFASGSHSVAIPGAAITGQANGADAISAIQALNLVGGAAGFSISSDSPVPAFIKTQTSTFSDAKGLIDHMRAGQVKVLLVSGANPLYDLPKQAGFADALAKVPFVVSFSPLVDETAVQADLIMPDRTYLESWGYEVVSPDFGQMAVSSQQPVVTPVFDSRSTADIMLQVARGFTKASASLPWPDEVAMLKDAVSQLPAGSINGSGADVIWARFQQHGGWWATQAAAAVKANNPKPVTLAAPQYQGDANQYPYFLHIYLHDFLSDGRGANLPWLQGSPVTLNTGAWQTMLEIHPDTATKAGLQDGDVVTVTSPQGAIEAFIYTYPGIRPDTVAIATGQGHTDYGRYARERGSNPIQLIGAQPDQSGNSLVWATTRVKITPTGKKVALAIFEYKLGVTEGFINQAFPGQ